MIYLENLMFNTKIISKLYKILIDRLKLNYYETPRFS